MTPERAQQLRMKSDDWNCLEPTEIIECLDTIAEQQKRIAELEDLAKRAYGTLQVEEVLTALRRKAGG